MSNSFSVSIAPEVAAVKAVVDAIRATDVVALALQNTDIKGVADAIRATDVVALALQNTNIKGVADAIRATDVVALAVMNTDIKDVVDAIRATDVVEIKGDIAGLTVLTEEEHSLIGAGVFPGFRDYFNTIGDDVVPNVADWNAVLTGGSARVRNFTTDQPGYCVMTSGTAAGNCALISTRTKHNISLKRGVTSVRLKAPVRFDWTDETGTTCGIGLLEPDIAETIIFQLTVAASMVASVVVEAGVPTFYSSDGAANETTNASAWISNNTWFDLEIVISGSAVEFIIDGTSRATHSARKPNAVWHIVAGSANIDTVNDELTKVQGVDLSAA